MTERHAIPHFKALIVNIFNPGDQWPGFIKSLLRPFLLKSTLFTKSMKNLRNLEC